MEAQIGGKDFVVTDAGWATEIVNGSSNNERKQPFLKAAIL
jgi:hypothetical protein